MCSPSRPVLWIRFSAWGIWRGTRVSPPRPSSLHWASHSLPWRCQSVAWWQRSLRAPAPQDKGQTATVQDAPVTDCVASDHGQDMNLMPELPTRQKRPAYALSLGDVPPGLRVFLDGVANFFTRTVNLERQSQAVAQSTSLKAPERMLCKCINREWCFSELGMYVTFATPRVTWLYFCLFIAGYLGFLKRYLGMELQPEVFLRVPLMEQYFNFLRVSGSFFSPHHQVKVWVIAQWAHTKSTCWLPLKHIKAAAMTITMAIYFLLLFKGLQFLTRMWFKKTILTEILRSSCTLSVKFVCLVCCCFQHNLTQVSQHRWFL